MQTKTIAGVAKLVLAVFIGMTTAQAQSTDRTDEYKAEIASIEHFNKVQREADMPEMDIPAYEEWLKAKRQYAEASAVAGSNTRAAPSGPSKQERMRQWLNKGVRTTDDKPSSIANVQMKRRERLWAKSAQLLKAHRREMEEAREWTKQHGFAENGHLPGGGVIGLVGIRNGIPQYNITFNAQAADTISVDELWPGGSTGLGLNGTNVLLGVWDGGDVQTNHFAFTYGGPDRARDQDGVSSLPIDPHPTAVAGVMAASGLGYTNAKGMAYGTELWTYDWKEDLETEMNSAYANDLRVSNHSYGKQAGWGYVDLGWTVTNCWWGDIALSPNESHLFGLYHDDATNADAVAYGNPHSLPVWASGNERDDAAPPSGTQYVTFSGTNALWQTGNRPNDYFQSGYDTISDIGVAKNVLVVGATYKILGGYSGITSVALAPFSSCGPTDDGRIKPDVVAAGVDHFTPFWHPDYPSSTTYYFPSTGDTNNPSWATGTSFSSPSVAGACGLLVELRERYKPGSPFLASTLKAVVIHSADEAETKGPDYRTGWGLVNAAKAGQLVQADHDGGGKQFIAEVLVTDGDYVERTVTATGGVPLKVTIAWTDPAGPAQPEQLDPTNLVLVNDFDVRVIGPGGTTNFPYILDPSNPANAATKGDNCRDNVEQVVITNPVASADYIVRVTHKRHLVDDTGSNSVQALSIIFSGILEESRTDSKITDFIADASSEIVGWPSVVGQNYQVQTTTNLLLQAWTNTSAEISATKTNTTWDSGSAPSEEIRFYRLIETN
ncbi:MAG: S8 family serine peptidase [Kiritimatiellae bacterium]|nr:S8 family serine peptidase [Kiritimatiellia bacterium]